MRKGSTRYSTKVAMAITRRVCLGEAIKHITDDDDMPCEDTFYTWLLDGEHEELNRMYEKALQVRAYRNMDELNALAKEARGEDSAGVQAIKLQVDTMKWSIVKLLPGKYGDRLDLNHGANDSLRQVMDMVSEDADCGIGAAKSRKDKPAKPATPETDPSLH